jgi:hypothetical protein
MKDKNGNLVITDKAGGLIKASHIKEVTAEEDQSRECEALLENGQRLKVPLSIRQVMRYLSEICNQKTIG